MITITVPGDPVAQPRHYTVSVGSKRGPRAFRQIGAKASHPIWEYKDKIVHYAIKAMAERGGLFDAPVLSIEFYFPSRKPDLKKVPRPAEKHTTRPDLDNLIKGVKDALTRSGAVWKDDNCVWMYGHMAKYRCRQGEQSRTVIRITEGAGVHWRDDGRAD